MPASNGQLLQQLRALPSGSNNTFRTCYISDYLFNGEGIPLPFLAPLDSCGASSWALPLSPLDARRVQAEDENSEEEQSCICHDGV